MAGLNLDRVPIVKDIRADAREKLQKQKAEQEEKFQQSPYGQYLQAKDRLDGFMTNSQSHYIVYDDDF